MSYISAGDSNSNFNIDSSSGLITTSVNGLSFSTNGASVTLVLRHLCHIFQLVTAIVTLILTVALSVNALSFSTNRASVTLVLRHLCHIFQLVTAIVTLILTVALD